MNTTRAQRDTPAAGAHLDANRAPTLELAAPAGLDAARVDDAFYPALGYLCGLKAPNAVPLLTGVGHLPIGSDELKGFGAAFGSSSAAPLFHVAGVTPEAVDAAAGLALPRVQLTFADLARAWASLDSGRAVGDPVGLVSLGSPHLSLTEVAALAALCARSRRHDDVSVVATLSRATLAAA